MDIFTKGFLTAMVGAYALASGTAPAEPIPPPITPDRWEQQYLQPLEVPYRKLLPGFAYPESCLATVQAWVPELPRGIINPNGLTPALQEPFIGAVILTTENAPGRITGHAGQVVGYTAGEVSFRECNVPNVHGPGRCGTRTWDLDDPRIRGYEWVGSPLAP